MMKLSFLLVIISPILIPFVFQALATEVNADSELPRRSTTEWRIESSLKYDVLCFLNILTGDSFYTGFYQEVFEKFSPMITVEVQEALANIKRVIKDENGGIVSALLCLYFSATEDETIDDMLATLDNSEMMQSNLMQTPYYELESWEAFDSIRDDLKTVLEFLRDEICFEEYWVNEIRPIIENRINETESELGTYNIVPEAEHYMGFPVSSNQVTVYLLYFVKPHGIKVTGMRYLNDQSYPAEFIPMTAVHELMHPPYDWEGDEELRNTMELFLDDSFVVIKSKTTTPHSAIILLKVILKKTAFRLWI